MIWYEYIPCWLAGHRYGHISPDGYQYCARCGVARAAPCVHKWSDKAQSITQSNMVKHVDGSSEERVLFYIYVLRCEKCGDLKVRNTKGGGN